MNLEHLKELGPEWQDEADNILTVRAALPILIEIAEAAKAVVFGDIDDMDAMVSLRSALDNLEED